MEPSRKPLAKVEGRLRGGGARHGERTGERGQQEAFCAHCRDRGAEAERESRKTLNNLFAVFRTSFDGSTIWIAR